MPERHEVHETNEPIRQEIVASGAVKGAVVLGSLGMVLVIVVILLLATARPQGRFVALDATQHQAMVRAADARLTGFEVTEEGAARLDIHHAMQLVSERGVDLPLVAGGVAPAPEVAAPVEDLEDVAPAAVEGAPIYGAQCAACHQATGAGIPGAFPPLANHAYELYQADRDYMPLVMLYGLQGPIEVHGTTYNGLMPAFGQLDDDSIAAVLNHVLEAWSDADQLGDDYEPYAATDIEALRGQGLSGPDMLEYRREIGLP